MTTEMYFWHLDDLEVIFQRRDLTALNNYIEFKIPALVSPFPA